MQEGERSTGVAWPGPAPTIPPSLGSWFKSQFPHLFLHDARQVTSLGLWGSVPSSRKMCLMRQYLLGLYCSPGQATKALFFSPTQEHLKTSPCQASLWGSQLFLCHYWGNYRALKPLPRGSKQDTTQAAGISPEGGLAFPQGLWMFYEHLELSSLHRSWGGGYCRQYPHPQLLHAAFPAPRTGHRVGACYLFVFKYIKEERRIITMNVH